MKHEMETQTIRAMIRMYCGDNHQVKQADSPTGGREPGKDKDGLCHECAKLLEYSLARLEHCPFSARKPVCARCEVHCYNEEMRRRIRAVMRYAGPRMPRRHPLMALRHFLKTWLGLLS